MSTLRNNLDRLLQVQRLDSEKDKQTRLRPTTANIAAINATVATAQTELQGRRAELSKASGSLKDAELELAGIEKKVKDYEAKMRQGLVTNTREVMNFEKEFNQLNRQRLNLDDKILALMEQVDQLAASVAAADAKTSNVNQNLKTAKAAFHTDLARVEAEIGRIVTERENLAKTVDDPALIKRYEALRARPGNNGVGIAKTNANTCGACHMQIGTVAVAHAEIGDQLAVCENCGRIMA